jgi:hypothetical protein
MALLGFPEVLHEPGLTPLLLVATLAAIAATAHAEPRRQGTGYVRMRLVKIMDTEGWGQPVEVARLLIPSDWRSEGGVRWVQNMIRCPVNIIQISFRAASPDGLTGIEVLPHYSWAWSDDPMQQQTTQQAAASNMGCDANPLMNPVEFLTRMVVPRIRRGARVVGSEPMPKLAEAQQAKLMAAYGQLIQAQLIRGVRAEAGRVRLAYPINGAPVVEWMTATINTAATPTASSAALMNGAVSMTASLFTVIASDIYAVHAPQGQLDRAAPLFATIVASVRPNPQYTAAMAQFIQGMQQRATQGAMDRARIWRDAQQQIGNTITQTYEQNQRVQDRMAEQFSQSIRGVETYVDPRTNERVELSSGYDAWTNGKGEYILADTPGFDPAAELKEDWRPLRRERR